MESDDAPGAALSFEKADGPHRAEALTPERIFPADAAEAALAAIAAQDLPTTEKRQQASRFLRAALDAGRARLRERFEEDHRTGVDTVRKLAWLTDQIVVAAFHFVSRDLFRLGAPTTAEQIAVVAVGGYGRGELAPFSDVDLLFLTPYKQTAWGESIIESMLYMLWDMKMKVGHATRSVDECLRRAGSDYTIRTALLEKRFLAGSETLFETLDQRLWKELFERTGPEFVEAKLAERDARHERTGGSRYLLEPNVKESKGGLRDMQTLLWLAKYLYHVESADELVAKGVFTPEEATRCRWAEAHLWTIRTALHYVAGRGQEKLTFDLQVELAERFGYRAAKGLSPVERFMKRYFIAAKAVGDLTGIFCAALEQQHKKSPPVIGGLLRYLTGGVGEAAAPDSAVGGLVKDGRLTVEDPEIFRRDPTAILRFFGEALSGETVVHPNALREVGRSRRAIDEAARADPEAQRLFMDLLTRSRDPVRALKMMAVTGFLGRFIPDFGRVVGQIQFNMYHHYTVDEHSLLAVEIFHKLSDGQFKKEHPVVSDLAMGFKDRRVMAVALLLHDLGKGLPEDHSIVGEAISRRVCPMLTMSQGETDQVAWLIRHHLAMSDVAQKRDLSETKTITAFAQLVRSPARLNQLYVLTVCDIRAVGPGVLNSWKAQLLGQLYYETRALLTGEAQGVSRAQRVAAAQNTFREALTRARPDCVAAAWSDEEWSVYTERFTPPYWTALPLDAHMLHAELIGLADPLRPDPAGETRRGAPSGDEIRMATQDSPGSGATEVAFCTQDHPGLFARMAGALGLVGASVVDARAFTTKDGVAINSFWVQDQDGGPYSDQERLRAAVERVLMGEVVPREALKARRKLRPREQPFTVEPSVDFDNAAADLTTMIEVNGRDRVGLLHDLARALAAENVNIVSAVIATYGEHVVDVFYVKDVFGMKITQPAKQRRIERALLTAVEKSGPG